MKNEFDELNSFKISFLICIQLGDMIGQIPPFKVLKNLHFKKHAST